MGASSLVLDELMSRMASQALADLDGSRMEPIFDRENGRQDGLLVEASLERVVVFAREQEVLSLSDVSYVRRAMTRTQARRALLYVAAGTSIANAVMLLAIENRDRASGVACPFVHDRDNVRACANSAVAACLRRV